jgi:ethanolamine-phosphate phospho-lyase
LALETLIDALSLRAGKTLCNDCSASIIDHPNKYILENSLMHHQVSTTAAPAVYTAGVKPMQTEDILEKRQQLLGPNMALFFADQPLHIVKGRGCELFDSEGNSYLDCINNVAHVGHAHPRVAAAVSRQLFTLNTNSRYLHEGLVTLAGRLSETLPAPLQTVFPVVSGSEANDLAWRIACSWAENQGYDNGKPLHVCVVDHGYHGHTSSVIEMSAYKFWGAGGRKKATHVHVLPCPDIYRGKNLDGKAAAREALAAAAAAGGHIAAFFCESIISCGGQRFLPHQWLEDVYTELRTAGAICVADEVQCGFGRVGSAFWAFQTHRGNTTATTPDIVTMGKPMGNGFPCAAVVTTPTIAGAFNNGMEFFATYGGCTAAAAAAVAVLDVLHDEKLVENATEVGKYCMEALKKLQKQYPNVVGDVRGLGLMIGVELITCAEGKKPAPATAAFVKSHCKTAHKVLLSCEGPYSNVIKIKPPMCFSHGDVDRMVAAMADALEIVGKLSEEAAVALVVKNKEAGQEVQQRRADLGGYVDV